MLNLLKPRYVMPMHGDYKRIRLHAELADAVGIDPEDVFQGVMRLRGMEAGTASGYAEAFYGRKLVV